MSFIPIHKANVTLTSMTWPLASKYSSDIDAYWRKRTTAQPWLYDGEILLLYKWSLSNGRFDGECLKTDYRSFLFWREHPALDLHVYDFFSAGLVRSSEGWIMLGRAGASTSRPGAVFPPCGSLHPDDVNGTNVDLEASMLRELKEETGLDFACKDLDSPVLVFDGQRIVYLRPIMLSRSADEIAKDVQSFIASSIEPELAHIRFVRGIADIEDAAIAKWAREYIRDAWQDPTKTPAPVS